MEISLAWLPILACPVAMGLMMWLMMRGHKNQPADAARVPRAEMGVDDPLTSLRRRLSQVRTQQAAIGEEIARLSADGGPAERAPQIQPARVESRPPETGTARRAAAAPSPD